MLVAKRSTRCVEANGRSYVVGEAHWWAKLGDDDIELIHALRAEGLSLSAIAAKLDHVPGGVSKSTVHYVLSGRRRRV